MTAATPGRDELRERMLAALHRHDCWGDETDVPDVYDHTECQAIVDSVLPVVDTWVAAHTAEIGAAALNAAADACHSGGFNGGRFEGHEYPHEWLRARACAALDPPTEGQT